MTFALMHMGKSSAQIYGNLSRTVDVNGWFLAKAKGILDGDISGWKMIFWAFRCYLGCWSQVFLILMSICNVDLIMY